MCLFRRQLDSKSRRILSAGYLCLASSFALNHFESGFGHRHPAVFEALRFLLLGAAIGLMFWSSRRSGCCATRS